MAYCYFYNAKNYAETELPGNRRIKWNGREARRLPAGVRKYLSDFVECLLPAKAAEKYGLEVEALDGLDLFVELCEPAGVPPFELVVLTVETKNKLRAARAALAAKKPKPRAAKAKTAAKKGGK